MGKDSPSAPPPPDYAAAAKETASGNIEAARAAAEANRVNQVTPYGNLTYSQTPRSFDQAGYDNALNTYNSSQKTLGGMFGNTPIPGMAAPDRKNYYIGSADGGWTATQTLSPAQQALLNQQNKTSLGLSGLADRGLGYVNDALSKNITMADLPASMVNPGQTGQDALMARFQPQIDQSDKALQAQLANQGIGLGSEAYTNAMRVQNQGNNDLRSQAALNGIGVGQNAQNQQFQLKSQVQNQPLNMLNAVRSGSQVTAPSFVNTPQQATTSGPDMMGAAQGQNQYNMGLYNSQVASNNSSMGALTGLAGAGIGAYGSYAGMAAF